MKDSEIKELIKNYPQQNFNKSLEDKQHPLDINNPLYKELYDKFKAADPNLEDYQLDERIENLFIGLDEFKFRDKAILIFKYLHPDLFKWFLPNKNNNDEYYSDNLLESDLAEGEIFITELRLTELLPGTKLRIVFNQNGKYQQSNPDDYQDIIIGATGNYYADNIRPIYGIYAVQSITTNIKISDNEAVESIIFTNDYKPIIQPSGGGGSVMYQYNVPARNKFDSIKSIETDIGCYKQFIGNIDDLVKDLEYTREQVTKISMSRYFKRPVEYLFYKGTNLNTLYWDTEYKEIYDYEEHMEYSPFSIYVLRDSNITIGAQKQSILNHIKWAIPEGEERQHKADHMFEKYYIDRYINAKTAEDMLTERMALIARIAASDDTEEQVILQRAMTTDPLNVLDPMAGNRYVVGVNYDYNPTITYNNEPIDLREILRYDLDNLEPTETKISVGNGVYGDVFYQRVIMNYTFEEVMEDLKSAKETYETLLHTLENLRKNGNDPSKAQLDLLETYYKNYNNVLAKAINNWVTRKSDLELE